LKNSWLNIRNWGNTLDTATPIIDGMEAITDFRYVAAGKLLDGR